MSKESMFSVKSFLTFGWESVRTKLIELIGLMIWAGLVAGVTVLVTVLVFGGISTLVGNVIVTGILSFLGLLLMTVAYIAVCFGFIKNFLNLCRGEKLDLLAFIRVKPNTMISFIVAVVLCGVAVTIGCLLMIVPGLILLYLFMYVPFLIIDRDMGPIKAIRESISMAGGKHRSEIFVGLYVGLIILAFLNIMTILALTVVAIPMMYFMWVYPYMILTGDLERVKKCLSSPADDTAVSAAPAAAAAPAVPAAAESSE